MQALKSATRSLGSLFRSGWGAGVATAPPNSLSALRPGGMLPLQRVLGWGPFAVGQTRDINHGQVGGQLGRGPKLRWKLLRHLVTELVKHERILTTLARAKELRKIADWVVTMGKKGTVFSRRQAQSVFNTEEALHKTFTVLALRYKDRVGGYTRVLRYRKNRLGDNAPMAMIEYVDRPGELRESRPPATQLPYHKRIAEAESKGDTTAVEYYKQQQDYVVKATKATVAHRERIVIRYGRYARPDLLENTTSTSQAEESAKD